MHFIQYMRNTAKKLYLPKLEATHRDGSFDWPNTCPLKNAELSNQEQKRFLFVNKHSGQKFEVILHMRDEVPGSVWYFELEPMS